MRSPSAALFQWTFPVAIALQALHFAMVYTSAQQPYMDEVFHVPQAIRFQKGHWGQWDPKITTPPGLYGYSTVINKVLSSIVSFGILSTLAFRLHNLATLVLVLPIVLSRVVAKLHPSCPKADLERGWTLFMFPILCFFGSLYYTDVVSTLTVMLTYHEALSNRPWSSALVGCGQNTNIVWVSFSAVVWTLSWLESRKDTADTRTIWNPKIRDFELKDLKLMIVSAIGCISEAGNSFVLGVLGYAIDLAAFIAFVFWNGSISLGDKTNHIAGVHIPQLFYFVSVSAAFSSPLGLSFDILKSLPNAIAGSRRRIAFSTLAVVAISFVVKLNTIEHPFLLADNRHFVFYIWRRTVKLSDNARYLFSPVYYLSTVFLVLLLARSGIDTITMLAWTAATVACLVPAPLIEFRYYIVPYLIWRVHVIGNDGYVLLAEFALHAFVHVLTGYIFAAMPFRWVSEPTELQHFMW